MVSSYHISLSLLAKLTTLFLFLLTKGSSVSFNFTSFQPNMADLQFEMHAFVSDNILQLTKNQIDGSIRGSCGRASYNKTVQLWDPNTKLLTDFTTHFSFVIDGRNQELAGDGLAFFIAPFESVIPAYSGGGQLGLFGSPNDSNSKNVAVEFDTYANAWDPSSDHVGIDIYNIVSVTTVTLSSSMKNGSRVGNAWVSYDSASQNLSVFLSYEANNRKLYGEDVSLSYIVDLRNFLPEKVRVGFSGATGSVVQLNKILSWSFYSNLEISTNNTDTNSGAPAPNPKIETPNPNLEANNGNGKGQKGLWIGLSVGIICCGLGLVLVTFCKKRAGCRETEEDVSIDGEFERGAGPKRFTYRELSHATNNFSEEGKLGEGGFGGVYRGLLSDSNTEVAVKKVSKGSMQGKKEYVSEVKIISRLRHRNLVQLIGWCHKKGEFLLVYEYLPNGSLDSHLFGGKVILPWVVRHKITLGLASSLLYLHEEWEQCVVHRDIKASNVMLDSNCWNLKTIFAAEDWPRNIQNFLKTIDYMSV